MADKAVVGQDASGGWSTVVSALLGEGGTGGCQILLESSGTRTIVRSLNSATRPIACSARGGQRHVAGEFAALDGGGFTMAWNEHTMAALRKWLGPSTSYKSHPIDNGRFYEFIHAVWQEHQGLWDESLAREVMEREARELHPDYGAALINEMIEKRRSQGSLILDYLSHLRERGAI